MHPRQNPSTKLIRLADQQARVVTREQALGLGLNRHAIERLLAEGSWQRMASGVYLLSPLAPTWLAQAWAGILIGGDDARLGGKAAAHLHGLVEPAPDEISVLVPWTKSRPRAAGPWTFKRERPGVRAASRGAPSRTSVEDTLIDLAADPQVADRDLIALVTGAVQDRRTTQQRLRKVMAGRRFVFRRELMTSLVEEVTEGVRSVLERDYLRDVERAHALPTGHRQQRRRGTDADVWYKEFGTLVELDGRRGHEASEGRFRDMHRDNVATVDGLATLRYGHHDVHGQPCVVAREVGAVLMSRGWIGPVETCPHCRRMV